MNKAFSLIELVIAIGILGIVSTVLALIWFNTDSTFYVQKSKNNLQREVRSALDSIDQWTRKSTAVESSWTAPDLTAFTTDSNSIILKVQAIDPDNNLIDSTYDYVIFTPDSAEPNKLKRSIYADEASARSNSTVIYSDALDTLSFTFYDSSDLELTANYENTVLVKSNIILEEVVRGTTNQVDLSTQTKIRNK